MKKIIFTALFLLLAVSVAIADTGYTVITLPTARGDMKIYGEMYLPDNGKKKRPTVILSHGLGGNLSYVTQYAEQFAKAGYASYVFDFCGGGVSSRSDGNMQEMSVITEVADLNAALDFVRSLEYVDTKQLYLMGQSQGGLVSALVAAQRPDEISKLVMLYPALMIPEHMASSSVESIKARFGVGEKYVKDALTLDVYNEIPKYKKKSADYSRCSR